VELAFIRILSSLWIIANDQLLMVILTVQTISDSVSNMVVVLNKTLKLQRNVTNLHVIMVIPKVI
jgi:hypothetical protein